MEFSKEIQHGCIHFSYNYLARKGFRIDAKEALPEGNVTVMYEFEVTGKPDVRQGNGAPGTGKLFVNGKQVGDVDMDVTVPILFSAEGLTIGSDYGDTVDSEGYRPPFKFTGTVNSVAYDLSGEAIHDAEALARHAMSRQ